MEAIVARDGKEYIIEVNDCATTLMGESQEEDRKNIAELVLTEMEVSRTEIILAQIIFFVNGSKNCSPAVIFYIVYLLDFLQEKCQPLQIEAEVDNKADAQTATGAKTDVPSKPKGALAAAARTVSRGSLLGGGEGKPSMASTVLAMASKATSSASSAAGGGGASAAADTSKTPPPSVTGTTTQPAPAVTPAAASKPSTSKATPSASTTKPETTTINSRRARHDSQGMFES